MSQWDQNDNLSGNGQNVSPGDLESADNPDIYNTPDTAREAQEYEDAEKIPAESVTVEETSAAETDGSVPVPGGGQLPPNGGTDSPYAGQYGGDYGGSYGGNPYNNGNPYGGGTSYDSGNVYGGGMPYNNGNPYGGGNPYDSGNVYGGGMPYNNGNPYGGGQSYGNGNPYNNGNPYGGGQPYGSGNPYGNGQPYGSGNPYNNNTNPYSPYAVPPKKNKNGLIIGLVVTFVVLLLIAVFALTYKLTRSVVRNRDRYNDRDEYNFDDDWGIQHGDDYDHDDFYDDDGDDYGSGDPFGDDDGGSYDDDGYYELHDELRWDLSYVVDFEEYYEGDSEDEDAQGESGRDIYITYPVIAGDNVPNLDSLNRTIMDEVDFLKGVAEDAGEGVDVHLSGESYVTYMDEEKLSIVFQEDLYLDYGDSGQSVDYYLYSLNIDMENGVVLDNGSMVNTDDAFSVDFRQRSDAQNGEIDYLTSLSDQEITDYFKSDDIIVFYTPLGMEIGFNYEYGWVTVTYRDYEQYLQVF